ncbi:MAG: response regulator [Pseudomonadota bacterium]
MTTQSLKVLVVDDSAAARAMLTAAIESYAEANARVPEIQAASSGLEALRFLPANALDLIVTDINMPDVNGLELISFARRHPLHGATPIVVVTTQSAELDRDRALALGANGYCEKPVTVTGLLHVITPLLDAKNGGSR